MSNTITNTKIMSSYELTSDQQKEYKTVLVGDLCTGKTSLLNRWTTGDFTKDYRATLTVEETNLPISTNCGNVVLKIHDVGGQCSTEQINEAFKDADAAIFFFDLTDRMSYNNLEGWMGMFHKVSPHAKCVLVGTKCDSASPKMKHRDITIHKKYSMPYYQISSASNYNFEKPFLSILKHLTTSLIPLQLDSSKTSRT